MVFAATLCEIFYKWLTSDGVGPKDYWTIPLEYLDLNFEPGLLELYLANTWGDALFSLIGDTERRILWINTSLRDKICLGPVNTSLDENFASYEHAKFVQQLTHVMKVRGKERMKEILEVDEMPNKKNNSGIWLSAQDQNSNVPDVNLNHSKSVIYVNKQKKPHQCAYCFSLENEVAPFKMCQQCLDENWFEPMYYCCACCQVEHWFNSHQKEHLAFLANRSDQSPASRTITEPTEPKRSYVFNSFLAILLLLSFRSLFACLLFISKLYVGPPL